MRATTEVEKLFDRYLKRTSGNQIAAALLVLASAADTSCPTDELLSVGETAKRLRVSARTVYKLCESGALPHLNIGSGRGAKRIRPDDLASFEKQAIAAGKALPGDVTLEQLLAA